MKRTKILGIVAIAAVLFISVIVFAAMAFSPTSSTSLNFMKPSEEDRITKDLQQVLGGKAKAQVDNSSQGEKRVTITVPWEGANDTGSFVRSGGLKTISAFSYIFGKSEYRDISFVKIEYMTILDEKSGLKDEVVGYSYSLSRASSGKLKDSIEGNSLVSHEPFVWFQHLMDRQNGDDYYVNPTIQKEYYGK